MITANSSQFEKLNINKQAHIQNAGLTGKKFSKQLNDSHLRQTYTQRDSPAHKTGGGGSGVWANSSGKFQA